MAGNNSALVDLSFLPDQPQVRKRRPDEPALDLSFLPDQPAGRESANIPGGSPDHSGALPAAGAPLDLSFLPDQPAAPPPPAEPRFVDRMATGMFGAKEPAQAFPTQVLPAFPPVNEKPLPPGVSIYNQSLDAFLAGDQAKAYALAAKARQIQPDLVEAQRMMERIKPIQAHANKISTDTYNQALDAYLADDKTTALNLAHKALLQDRRNTEALRMVERLTQAAGLTTAAPVADPPSPRGRQGQPIYPPVSTVGEVIRGIPGAAGEAALDTLKDTVTRKAYEGAGLVRGLTMNYVDPTPALEQVPMFRDSDINKGVSEFGGAMIGAMAPMGLAVKGVEAATAPIKAFQAVRPWLMNLFKAGAAGGLYGAARKPGENETRAENAANDAAAFMAWTGAFQGIDRIMNKTILVPDAKKAEIFETAKEAGLDAYTKGGTKATARDAFLKTLEEEADQAVKAVKAGTPGTEVQPQGYTEPATEVHVPTAFSRGLARLLERVRGPSIAGARPNAEPFDVGFDAGGAEPLGGTSKPGPGPGAPPAPGFITFAGGSPKPLEVPIAPVRMLRPNLPPPQRFRIPQADIQARAEMIHHDAMQERNDKFTELERFILDNGGIATYKTNPNTGKVEEAEEYRDVPVRLRGGMPADIMAQKAADAGFPDITSGDDLREAIKRFQKRGEVPRIQDFYADARRELEYEYQEYGPPSRRPQRNFGTPEPQPFESRGEYNAGQPEKPIEAVDSRKALKVGPARAEFRFWQDRAPFDTPVPMYNILGDHPQFGSTVGATTLESLKIEIPPTPTFEEWKAGGSRVQEPAANYGKQLDLFGVSPQGKDMLAQAKSIPPEPIQKAVPIPPPPSTGQAIADFGEKIGGARKDTARPLGKRTGTDKPADLRPAWARKYVALQNKTTGKWSLYETEAGGRMHSMISRGIGDYPTQEAAMEAIPLAAVARNHRVYQNRTTGKWDIARLVRERGRALTVKGGFETENEALAYMVTNPVEIIETKFKFPERPWLDKLQRTGPSRRDGNATPAMFQKTFGFRGGEFGNWNMGADGQAALNFAYDGLTDLAEFLHVEPKALSLNGELGIAFGARGKGGKEAAAAHYEPDYGVINLTKIKGAGSLAHEWFHALDHYLGRQARGLDSARTPFGTLANVGDNYTGGSFYQDKTREELRTAFRKVMDKIEWRESTVPVAASEDKTLASQRVLADHLKNTVNELRKSLDGPHVQYNRTKRGADSADLAKWDELSKRLLNFDVGPEIHVAPAPGSRGRFSLNRPSFQVLEDMNGLYKKVTGRSFDTADEHSTGRHVYWNVWKGKKTVARLADSKAGATELVKKRTDYYRNAVDIDAFRASDYWSLPHELGARAFESFIFDKATKANRLSDYLVHGVENKYYEALGMKPYPEGEDREAIDGAFQNLVDTIKTEPTERGVRMFEKRAEYSGEGATNLDRMANLLARFRPGSASNLSGPADGSLIQKGIRFYRDKLFGKATFSPALKENVQFTSKGILYLARKGSLADKIRRMKLLPKVVPTIENALDILPQDVRDMGNGISRFGLLGRFSDGAVVRVIVEQESKGAKKFLSVFDVEDLSGDKLSRKLGTSGLGTRPAAGGVAPSGDPSLDNPIIPPSSGEVKGKQGPEGVAETQMGLFGGGEPAKAVTKKTKPVPEGQGTLFGGRAQPKFEVPKSAFTPEQIAQQTPAVQQLLATPEGKHQVLQKTLPEAIQESVVIKDLREIGQLATDNLNIQGPEDIAALVHILREMDVEKLLTVSLDANNKPMFVQMVAMGVLDSAITTPRDALKGAYAMGAKKVILIHNHPSLDPEPSPQDVTLTRLMVRHARAVGMEIPYHLVIDDDKFGYIHGEEDGVKYSGDVEIRPMRAIGKLEAGFVPIREGRQVGIGKRPDALSNPQMAAKYARTLVSSKSAQVGIALDTKNHPVGVWHIGEKWPESPNVLGKLVGKMILRNNAAGIILSADQLPAGSYLRELQASIRSWGATLLDVVAWDGETVKSAREKGTISGPIFSDTANMAEGETQYPYSTPGAKDFTVAEDESPYNAGGGGGDKPPARPTATGSPANEPSGKSNFDDTTEEAFYTDEPALPADLGTGAFSRFIEVGKNSNKFPPPEMKAALLDPEGKFHDLGFWDEGTLSTLAPIRAVERMDGKRYGLMKEQFLKPIQDSDKSFQWELKEELKGIEEVFKGMTKAEKQTVFDVIEKKGTSTGPKVDAAVGYLKDKYETLLDRLNAVRAKIGKDPIKKRANYITHFQEMSILQDIIRNFGFRVGNASVTDITDVPASMLAISDYTKANSPYFKFAKQRIGEMTERDAEKAYRLYIEPALRSIHMSRAIKSARDILEFKVKIKSEYEGSDPTSVSLFAIRYPIAYKYFTRYLNRLTGKRDPWDKELPGLAFVAGFTNRIFSAGSIAGNIGTVFTQFASFRNTAAETGPWALKGQALIMVPKWNRFYQENSRIAMGRSYEPSYKNERSIGSKMVSSGLDKFSQMASIPVSMTDNLMVGGAFLSGYFQAKGMGYTEAESIRHGDDVAERTQASANLVDRPPANQGKIKTMMGQFQTFIFNEYSQWKYDFLKQAFKGEQTFQGYGKGLGGMKQGKGRGYERFMYYVLGTLALGAIYDALGLPNPFRQEGATIPGGTDNSGPSKVWQHVVNQIPYISSVRFGGSPAVKGVLQGLAYIQGNEQQKRAALRKLASVGVRVFPMGGQISKTAGAWRLAVNEKDTWKAFKLLAFGKYQAKLNADKPDGKTRTVRTRTVSARGVRARTVRTRVAR